MRFQDVADRLRPWMGRPFDLRQLERADALYIAFICLWGLWLLAPGLAHPGMHDWDEVLHQAAARGTYDDFFRPHLYSDPLYPVQPHEWWVADVWLHKPIAPLWFGATVMKLIGVTPLAMRIGALLGQLGAAVAAYLLARWAAGRFWSAVGACGFLALPFGWVLTQGLLFGDSYDCMLVGFVSLTLALLVYTIERDSWRWAVATGVALGLGHLTKTVLALAPLGVAGVMVGLRWIRFSRGLRPTHLLLMGAAALLVTGPWNLYAALTWPEVYWTGAELTFGHINAPPGVDVGGWRRPVDAIFVEVNQTEFAPMKSIFPVVVGLWLIIRGIRQRESAVIATALWLWSTWLTHSFVAVKAPGHVWNAAPAVFVALALVASDGWRYPAMAAATITALLIPEALQLLPGLSWFRSLIPPQLPQVRAVPGLAEGVVLCTVMALLTHSLFELTRRAPAFSRVLGTLCGAMLLVTVFFRLPSALKAQPEARKGELLTSYHHVLGPVLDRTLPKKSVLFQAFDHDPHASFEIHSSLFWSGRMTYRRPVDLPAAHAKGYHAYVVSPAAEPYAPVPGVPAYARLRAYDAEVPASPPPIPEGATPLDVQVDGMRVLGFASGAVDGRNDDWVFFIQPEAEPVGIPIFFETRDGRLTPIGTEPELSLRSRRNLVGVPWFILPVLGPPREQVVAIEFGADRHRVTLEQKPAGTR